MPAPTEPMTETPSDGTKTWRRRGLFAAAWAAVAAIVIERTTQPVEAARTNLTYEGSDPNTEYINDAYSPVTIYGQPAFSRSFEPSVVQAYSFATGISAITGDAGSGGRHGLVGVANGSSGYGVYGQLKGTANGIAMAAVNGSSFKGASPGGGGWGIYGGSQWGHALVGASTSPGAGGMVGSNNGVAGAYAGLFYGATIVSGSFTVVGGAKSAAVPHPDGTLKRLYCVESPESWFEDFGKGQLECGIADVVIDPNFSAVANTDDYHVFLTGYDGQADLSPCELTASGFRVRATSGNGSGAFSWRIVSKRKDIAAPRFETVEVPAAPVIPEIQELGERETYKPDASVVKSGPIRRTTS